MAVLVMAASVALVIVNEARVAVEDLRVLEDFDD
jgi:hypothetical protein